MVYIGCSTRIFAGVGLAVPRLGNVRLRLHFLIRGTSGLINNATIEAYVVKGEIVSLLQGKVGIKAEGKIYELPETKLPFYMYWDIFPKNIRKIAELNQSVQDHSMKSVIDKIENER